jgi:metal-responsive CopG/Arc/MetJ family transcriptional regulator
MDPEERTTTIAVTMPAGLVERLDAVAEQRGWNRSEAVREAVQALVKRK